MNRIKELRETQHWTMRDAAEKIGLAYTTYVGYEKELRDPDKKTWEKIADFYAVSLDYLFGRTSNMNENIEKATSVLKQKPQILRMVFILNRLDAEDLNSVLTMLLDVDWKE